MTKVTRHISMKKLYQLAQLWGEEKYGENLVASDVREGVGWVADFLSFVWRNRNRKDL